MRAMVVRDQPPRVVFGVVSKRTRNDRRTAAVR